MKKVFFALLALIALMTASACGSNTGTTTNAGTSSQPQILDLTGEWKQVNGDSETSYQVATITADYIEVYWVNSEKDTKSLYWAGSFTAPDSNPSTYSWDSENDKDKTSSALLASSSDTKTFTYKDGQISYDVSALGTTKTVKLEKQ